MIGLPARRVYRLRGHELEVEEGGEVIERRHLEDPLGEIELLRKRYEVPKLPGLPDFIGGLVGYFGFEAIGYIEERLAQWDKKDEFGTPDVLLMLADEIAVFDNLKGRLYLIVHADPSRPQGYAEASRRLDALPFRLRQGALQRGGHDGDWSYATGNGYAASNGVRRRPGFVRDLGRHPDPGTGFLNVRVSARRRAC